MSLGEGLQHASDPAAGKGRSSNWGRGRGGDQSLFLISLGLSFVSKVKNKAGSSGIG